ncbi:MAG: hypothetical protein BMS9Abin39_0260 [Ignavibacteria bacterium]|nr:MAG: hypothetical protein BMS9Abin39_0260 [Ignavibacteria bacterium]
MKKLIIVFGLIFWGLIGVSEDIARPKVSGYFYNALIPYGNWIEIDYGVVVWQPTIMRVDWSPYRDGRWIWTSDGWYWYSYEPFGYIAYHYGRWYFDDYYGWLWYPEYEWAPAWVEWRYNGDYIGWAPLNPYAVFSISEGIYFTKTYYTPYYQWNFVTYRHFYDPYVYNQYVAPRYKYRVYSNTRYRNNYVYRNGRIRNNGVDVKIVRTRSGQNIRQRDVLRVSDQRSLNNGRANNTNQIRTFYKSRDELVRNEVKNMKIKRGNRKSSLDVSLIKTRKIKDRNIVRPTDKNRTKKIKTSKVERYSDNKVRKTKTNKGRKNKTSVDRKKSDKTVIMQQNNTVKKKIETNKFNKNSALNKKRENRVQSNNKQRKKVKVNRNNDRKVNTVTSNQKRVKINNSSGNRNKTKVKTKRNNNNRLKVKTKSITDKNKKRDNSRG